ncbi:MAG TPA: MAPEG family protein [Terricaulis sp.]|nr:MAPEG family protein [Terricaulis sp.]
MYEHGLIAPAVALVVWSLVMLVWLYATRIPAMFRAGLSANNASRAEIQALPSARVADNYNHLMEQPTIFYALCFALQLMNQDSHINVGLAWAYVVLRVAHSLVQATVNIIIPRFLIFVTASLVLMALALHAVMALGWVRLPH